MSLFEGKDLLCVRGERVVFEGLSFALDQGEAILLTGANGSGKSSLLRLMAGLLRPIAGELRWKGAPIDSDDHNQRLHYVGHMDAVKPALTVAENLQFWTALAGSAPQESGSFALSILGLSPLADIPARMLSAGQKRRLALARLIAIPAPLWLLDEPTIALDAQSAGVLREAILAHLKSGGLAAIATHSDLGVPGKRIELGGFGAGALPESSAPESLG